MTTAFQRNAFQNNAFQIDSVAGSGDWGGWLVLSLMQEERRAKAKRRKEKDDAIAAEEEITREQVAARLVEIRSRLRAVPSTETARAAPIITDLGPLQQAVRARELSDFKVLTEAILAADDWLDAA